MQIKRTLYDAQGGLLFLSMSILWNLFFSFQEFSIDPDCDGEQVDEFLHACLQASSAKPAAEGNQWP